MKKTILAITAMVFLFSTICMAAETFKIGVLAKNGPVKALKQWKSTADFLTANIGDKSFEIVPLDFTEVNPAIERGDVDFFLVNSSMFVTAKIKYGASPIATMVNSRQGQPLKSFGGVIFTTIDNDEINTLSDVNGKTFMAVENSSFGGWQMAYKEFLNAGIDPYKGFAKIEFGGKHDNVVLSVQNGVVDCGTVRTDTLERMAADGLIDMDEFKIINKSTYQDFPFVCSTALYPEWPLAKTQKTPDSVAREVVEALKQLKESDAAAKDAKVVGWVDALDYSQIEELQAALKIGPYATN
jgi:phosphate/phosphite/phosphonate ABC transporter binding protein